MLHLLTLLALVIGLTFNTLGIAGILRFPDVYTRLHADTKATTFGSIFIALAAILYGCGHLEAGRTAMVLHIVIAVLILAFTNAVGAHAISRAAHRSGVKPAPSVVDQFEEDDH